MRVAPHHDGGPLGHPQIALAQLNALALGALHQLLDRAVGKPGIGRMCDRLLLYGGTTATRSRSSVAIAPLRCATERLSCNSAAICSSPSRWRQRVSDERSNGSSCRNTASPAEVLEIRVLHPFGRTAPRRRGCACA